MSELQRSFAKAKLASLPIDPPLPFNEVPDEAEEEDEQADDLTPLPDHPQDDDSSSASSASSASSTGTIRPSPSKHLFARPRGFPNSKNTFDPLPWNDYFSQELYLKHESHERDETITHHVYITPPLGKGPLLVTHHGAGSSGLSFALFASEIRKVLPKCGVLSLDARGHGETVVTSFGGTTGSENNISKESTPDGNLTLDLKILSMDLYSVIRMTRQELAWPELPDLVLIGHSLGGAVVTDLSASGLLGKAVLGYAVLDVAEGSAMDRLQSMQQYLSTRPKSFSSIQSAIEWHTRSRTIRSLTSARISVPSLLRRMIDSDASPQSSPLVDAWTWRTDLSRTQAFWPNWFTGLSEKFLTARGGKLLVIAGTDRLDTQLTIGQMQGKFQLEILPEAGHFVHEDRAEKTAGYVAEFVRRNDRGGIVLPPKVEALLKPKEWPSEGES